MSREIKFRAWLEPRWENDTEANKMYYDVQNSYDTLGDVAPEDIMISFRSWLYEEHAIIEQFTGLKDQEGNDVYEGDIVMLLDKHVFIDDGWMCVKGVVEYGVERKGFVVSPAVDEDYDLLLTNKTRCIVIGNIHEEVKNENTR